jgi:hypothetical protein
MVGCVAEVVWVDIAAESPIRFPPFTPLKSAVQICRLGYGIDDLYLHRAYSCVLYPHLYFAKTMDGGRVEKLLGRAAQK